MDKQMKLPTVMQYSFPIFSLSAIYFKQIGEVAGLERLSWRCFLVIKLCLLGMSLPNTMAAV